MSRLNLYRIAEILERRSGTMKERPPRSIWVIIDEDGEPAETFFDEGDAEEEIKHYVGPAELFRYDLVELSAQKN